MPGRGRPFKKGQSGNPGGRPRVLADVQDLARQQCPDAISTLGDIMRSEKTPPAARVAAPTSLLDRGYGKPSQPVSQTLAKRAMDMTDEELLAVARGERTGIRASALGSRCQSWSS